MTREIRSIHTKLPEVRFFGFGSFFWGGAFRDVDIVAVFLDDGPISMRHFERVRHALSALASRYGLAIDLTVLTSAEFDGKPLRDMEQLIEIV